MNVVERGQGTPLVFIPGLQGRWEMAGITVDALARHFRVFTFSLDERQAPGRRSPGRRSLGEGGWSFDDYAAQIERLLDERGCGRAVICGLSFGGRIALRFAAKYPDRCDALVLASTPGPGFHLRPRHDFYARLPYLFGPVFLVEAPFRARREMIAALPSVRDRCRFGWRMLRTVATAWPSVSRMAARARLIATHDVVPDCASIVAPTLVVTGEPGLDFVVKVDGTQQYGRLIKGAHVAVLEATGHQGTLTRPHEFASMVRAFVARARDAAA